MRSREGEEGGRTTLSSRSKLSARLSHPAPELPFDKMPPLTTRLFTPSPTPVYLACAGGISRAVLPVVELVGSPDCTAAVLPGPCLLCPLLHPWSRMGTCVPAAGGEHDLG